MVKQLKIEKMANRTEKLKRYLRAEVVTIHESGELYQIEQNGILRFQVFMDDDYTAYRLANNIRRSCFMGYLSPEKVAVSYRRYSDETDRTLSEWVLPEHFDKVMENAEEYCTPQPQEVKTPYVNNNYDNPEY